MTAAEPTRRRYAPRMPAEERRAQLLDAALKLIAEQGYERVSMEGIARTAGVAKPVVYDLFGTLADLLEALLEREEERALLQLAELITPPSSEDDPEQVLVDGMTAFLRAVQARPDAWRVILTPTEALPGIVRERIERQRSRIATEIESTVRWGLKRLDTRIEDVELLVDAIIILVEEGARLHLSEPDRYPPERITAFAASLIASVRR